MQSAGTRASWGRSGRVVFAGIILLAVSVRLPPLDAGLPYATYVDEGYVTRPANHLIADGTVDPGGYNYPSLTMGLTAAIGTIGARTVGDWERFSEDVHASEASEQYDIAPAQLLLAGRVMTLAASVGLVAVSMLLFLPLVGRRAALLGGLLLALSPVLVTRSAIVIVDTPASFLWMLALLLASRIGSSRRPRWTAVAAGAATGLAATSKYTAGLVGISVVVLILALTPDWREGSKRVVLAGAGGALAVVLTMPVLLVNSQAVIAEYRELTAAYEDKTSPSTWTQLRNPAELGLVMLVPAAIGLTYLAWHRRTRLVTLAWAAGALPFLALLQHYSYQPVRNVLPLIPFLVLAVATILVAASDALVDRWSNRHPDTPGSRLLRIALPTLMALAIGARLYASGIDPYYDAAVDVVDSRSHAVEWLVDNTSAGDTVLVVEELAILPGELERIQAEVVVLPALDANEVEAAEAAGADFLVTGRFELPAQFPGPLQPWAEPGREPLATFGRSEVVPAPNLARGSNQAIEIHPVPEPPTGSDQPAARASEGAPPGSSRKAS